MQIFPISSIWLKLILIRLERIKSNNYLIKTFYRNKLKNLELSQHLINRKLLLYIHSFGSVPHFPCTLKHNMDVMNSLFECDLTVKHTLNPPQVVQKTNPFQRHQSAPVLPSKTLQCCGMSKG